jgi:hypothetical protein
MPCSFGFALAAAACTHGLLSGRGEIGEGFESFDFESKTIFTFVATGVRINYDVAGLLRGRTRIRIRIRTDWRARQNLPAKICPPKFARQNLPTFMDSEMEARANI